MQTTNTILKTIELHRIGDGRGVPAASFGPSEVAFGFAGLDKCSVTSELQFNSGRHGILYRSVASAMTNPATGERPRASGLDLMRHWETAERFGNYSEAAFSCFESRSAGLCRRAEARPGRGLVALKDDGCDTSFDFTRQILRDNRAREDHPPLVNGGCNGEARAITGLQTNRGSP